MTDKDADRPITITQGVINLIAEAVWANTNLVAALAVSNGKKADFLRLLKELQKQRGEHIKDDHMFWVHLDKMLVSMERMEQMDEGDAAPSTSLFEEWEDYLDQLKQHRG